jgi:hypothetical protein
MKETKNFVFIWRMYRPNIKYYYTLLIIFYEDDIFLSFQDLCLFFVLSQFFYYSSTTDCVPLVLNQNGLNQKGLNEEKKVFSRPSTEKVVVLTSGGKRDSNNRHSLGRRLPIVNNLGARSLHLIAYLAHVSATWDRPPPLLPSSDPK